MQQYNIAFAHLEQFLPFLHIMSVALLVGIWSGFWIVSKYFLKEFSELRVYEQMLDAIKFFSYVSIALLVFIVITGILLVSADTIKSADPMANAILTTKIFLSLLILVNIFYMWFVYIKCIKAFGNDEIVEVHENLIIIIKYFMPFSIVVAMVATYLGVAYRGF